MDLMMEWKRSAAAGQRMRPMKSSKSSHDAGDVGIFMATRRIGFGIRRRIRRSCREQGSADQAGLYCFPGVLASVAQQRLKRGRGARKKEGSDAWALRGPPESTVTESDAGDIRQQLEEEEDEGGQERTNQEGGRTHHHTQVFLITNVASFENTEGDITGVWG
ncbi:hypothetical protein E2562_014070 [Oryza meyeriana var. granulata]|uniref:Uncharacterized protein n=1 Tax=Oryza meyeriana var. granulata TaxID=110450 RepID=A0A6G1DJ64_9ORYZ|nr:hypothetical protein E2562_014070 [Oryza meyeriana var. granulata]